MFLPGDGQTKMSLLTVMNRRIENSVQDFRKCIISWQARVNMRLGEWAPGLGQLTSACSGCVPCTCVPTLARHYTLVAPPTTD